MNLKSINDYLNKLQPPGTRRAMENLVGHMMGTKVPASGSGGYLPGAVFNLVDCVLGQCPQWINIGTYASCIFAPVGGLNGWGFKYAGILDATSGSTTDAVLAGLAEGNDIPLVGFFASDDNDQAQAYITAGKSYLTLKNSADPSSTHDYQWALMRSKCTPDWDIFAAGEHTTVGGNVAEAITVTGAQAGDIARCCYGDTDDTDVIKQAVVSANTLTVTCSADPLVAHVINYVILRPRGTFKPSHYVAYAGKHTSIADSSGPATNDITITGSLTTDIPIIGWGLSDDADTFLECEIAADGTLTVTFSANPLTAHAVNYAILRAY